MGKIALTIEDGKVKADIEQVSMEEMSMMLTGLAAMVVTRADAMLDIALGVTEGLTDKKVEELRQRKQKGNEDEGV